MHYFAPISIGQIAFLATFCMCLLLLERLKATLLKAQITKISETQQSLLSTESLQKINLLTSVFLWGFFSFTALHNLANPLEQNVLYVYSYVLRNILTILILVLICHVFIQELEKKFTQKKSSSSTIDGYFIHTVFHILKILVYLVGGLCILSIVGIPISGILAVGGVGGLAIGFAVKDIIANLLSGFLLSFDKLFSIGDCIEIPSKNIEGVVTKIGFRTTEMRLLSKDLVYLPNSTLSQIHIVNKSRKNRRQIMKNIGLRYEDANKLSKIKSDIETYLKNHPGIDENQVVQVALNNFEESSLGLSLWCYTYETSRAKFNEVVNTILCDILKIIENNKAALAYPTRLMKNN